MKNTALYIFILGLSFTCCKQTYAQDTTRSSGFLHNIFQSIVNTVTVAKGDSTAKATVLYTKSEKPYERFEGRIIRNIVIRELGFEKVFTDTSKTISYYGTRILNYLHTDTWEWVIRDNLFIKEGTKLNRYVVADNERYLRSLEFIQDARIIAKTIRGTRDSIDLEVITKDLFSISGSVDISSAKRQKINIAESNLAGAGQKVEVTALIDKGRTPSFGYAVQYTKNSLLHSFINASIGYSKIATDRQGDEGVSSLYVQLQRPLVSAYSRMAGGFGVSFNKSNNRFAKPDSTFFDYQNHSFDTWVGYNIGVKKLLEDNKDLNRTFAAVRYFQNTFDKKPWQIADNFDPYFNNRQGILGEITLFRQEFYQTNYIYGFGTTEDVPYGYNVALTGGYYKQLELERPYFGINANRYTVTNKGEFIHMFVRAGAFPYAKTLTDASLVVGGGFYSKLYLFKNVKLREYVKFSVTRLFNTITNEPLRINNALGLQYFGGDSLSGRQRMSMYAETFSFLKYKLFGFQLAPFGFVDASLLTGEQSSFFKSDLFTGIGGGMRTRNENLIFGTIEFRFVYFPRKVQDMNPFKFSLVTNLRFRYNTNYVKAPDVIQLNSNDTNNFY
jgi:hypothetical protein